MSLPAGEDFRFAGAGLDDGLLRLDLSLKAGVSERLRLFAEGAVEARGLPGSLATLDDLASPATLGPDRLRAGGGLRRRVRLPAAPAGPARWGASASSGDRPSG